MPFIAETQQGPVCPHCKEEDIRQQQNTRQYFFEDTLHKTILAAGIEARQYIPLNLDYPFHVLQFVRITEWTKSLTAIETSVLCEII